MNALLEINDLKTSFFTYAGEVKAIDGISFSVAPGEAVALVGESGCGKSVTALSIMRLISYPGKIVSGSILFNGTDLAQKTEKQMQAIRGNEIGMVFQDPMTSLNPVLSVRNQLTESLILHKKMDAATALNKALDLMRMVGIPSPETRINQYPHQFSGGMRQRVMIAMALACEPKLLIADEPTTALDVTIQAQILQLMKELKTKINTSIVLITHDLGVVAGLCQKVIVMYGGRIAEAGLLRDIFYHPRHPYTWGLLKSAPRIHEDAGKKLVPIWGQPPDLLDPPRGCRFVTRCEYAMKICATEPPPLIDVTAALGSGASRSGADRGVTGRSTCHQAACWLLDSRAPKVDQFLRKGAANG